LLLEREQYYFDTLNPTYNILPIAASSLGSKRSAEVRQRMSNAQKLVNRTGVNHPLFGKGHSDKTRQKMSASKLGHLVTEEARKKMSKAKTGFNNSMYGKSHSEETKLRISSALSRPVFVYSLTNSLVKEFISQKQAANWLNTSDVQIGRYVKSGKVWKGMYYLTNSLKDS